ncbi:MAG: hypothetical protein MJ252_25650 [archaeon]|nr:hypothetical protein [archaeon]
MSTFGSSVGEKRRIIIRNPDGTLMHCYKSGERDSTFIPKKEKQMNDDSLSIADSELDYIVQNYEQFDNGNIIEEFLNIFKKNQFIFLVILSSELILSLFLGYESYSKRDTSIKSISQSYKMFSLESIRKAFFFFFYASLVLNFIFYPFGYYAILSKKYKLVSIFSGFALVTGIVSIFFVYANMLFILTFILRLILYTFSKFISSLLVSIIVLPRRMQQNQYDTIENVDDNASN